MKRITVWILVGLLVWGPLISSAAPKAAFELNDPTPDSAADQPIQAPSQQDQELSVIAPPPVPVAGFHRPLYPYRQSFSPRLGHYLDVSGDTNSWTLGLKYLAPSSSLWRWEFGADISFQDGGFLHMAQRWIPNPRDYFRPYFHYGLSLFTAEAHGLATFAEIQNYLIHTGVGIEDFLSDPLSVRIEIEAYLGTEYQLVLLSLGYSWGF